MKRPILWATIFMICGIYMRLGISKWMCLVSFLFPILFMSYYVIYQKRWTYSILLFFVIFGFLRTDFSTKETEILWAGIVSGEGVVREEAESNSGNQKLTIICNLENEAGNRVNRTKVYALWSGEGRVEAGDHIRFAGNVEPFYEQTILGGYNEKLYLETKGYDTKIYLDWIHYIGEDNSILSVFARMRANVHQMLDRLLPQEESGIMKAMLTGDKEDIPEDEYQIYTEAGIVHMLCISGLHMNCLAVYVSFLLEKILNQNAKIVAVFTILASLSFLLFTGFTPSAMRAVTMICVVMLGRILYRSNDRLNNIAIAACLILILEPRYLFHIGFQLSFVTVLGLYFAAQRRKIVRRKDKTWKTVLKESLEFSLYATVFSAPIVAYHFYSVSSVAILANLVVIPLSGLLLGLGILSVTMGFLFFPAGIFLAGTVYAGLRLLKGVCLLLLRFPFAYVLIGRPSEVTIVLLYLLFFCWIRLENQNTLWKPAIVSVLLFFSVFYNSLLKKETTVAFLDVGQGDCAVIREYNGATYLVDGGGEYQKAFGKNVGKYTVLPYLEYLGVKKLEGAFLSHPDKDHMIGLLEVLESIPTKRLYVSDYPFQQTEDTLFLQEMVKKHSIPLYAVKNGDKNDTFSCLYPMQKQINGDDNHGSMVLQYRCHGVNILFTGDISSADEAMLMKEEIDVSSHILKVSHHGSKYSSGQTFLSAVDADAAILSCGRNNGYGHPHTEVLSRLEGVQIFRTDQNGSIFVTIRKDGTYKIETMSERRPFYENIKKRLGSI